MSSITGALIPPIFKYEQMQTKLSGHFWVNL